MEWNSETVFLWPNDQMPLPSTEKDPQLASFWIQSVILRRPKSAITATELSTDKSILK